MFTIELPPQVAYLLDGLSRSGFLAYAVGGCVRDSLLGRPVHDWDVTTSALPEQIKEIFSSRQTIDIGIRHGTVAVVLDGRPYEITTFRVDGSYSDARHPDDVTFTSFLAADLARRDFTVNAMAYAPQDGLIDLFDGQKDLKNKIIRTVGEPAERFGEDALRILRALRFASVLSFSVHADTAGAIDRQCGALVHVSEERKREEISHLLLGPAAADVLGRYSRALSRAWPEIPEASFVRASASLACLPEDLTLRLACLTADLSHDECLTALQTKRYSTREIDRTLDLLSAADRPCMTRADMLRLLGAFSPDVCLDSCRLRCALGKLTAEEADDLSGRLRDLAAGSPCCRIADLAIDGGDLLEMGYRGAEIGETLRRLLDAVIEGKCENTNGQLRAFLHDTGNHK